MLMLAVMALFITVGVQAQITTAAMGGRVIDDTGEAVIGASVRAVHEPSGSVYGAVTNVDGRYSIQGIRDRFLCRLYYQDFLEPDHAAR